MKLIKVGLEIPLSTAIQMCLQGYKVCPVAKKCNIYLYYNSNLNRIITHHLDNGFECEWLAVGLGYKKWQVVEVRDE